MAAPTGSSTPELHRSGERITESRPGSLFCTGCGWALPVASLDALPECPNCGGQRFRRASLFDRPTIDTDSLEVSSAAQALISEARLLATEPGRYIAWPSPDDELEVVKLEEGWTRVGRSGAADLQLDDVTVSRRHALIVLTEDGELRALDDRSLNGLFVNGERVEWARLSDGDELEIGRYRLYVIEA